MVRTDWIRRFIIARDLMPGRFRSKKGCWTKALMNNFSGKFKRLPVQMFFVFVPAQPRKDGVLTSRLLQRGATSVGNDLICLGLEENNIPAAIRDINS